VSRLAWLPEPVRTRLHNALHAPRLRAQRRALRELGTQPECRIIIGSSGTRQPGWTPTDYEVLDLLREASWSEFFPPGSIDAILAEHVWEHLDAVGGAEAARICFRFLKPGGYLRVAVPDGLHPDPAYIESVRPGGSGPGADDHKVLYTAHSAQQLFERAGFAVQVHEWFDAEGQFHGDDWDSRDGMIQRSRRFDERNLNGSLAYTSIVLDARKAR
jgi:predicted SAM-dependent methyltransferase